MSAERFIQIRTTSGTVLADIIMVDGIPQKGDVIALQARGGIDYYDVVSRRWSADQTVMVPTAVIVKRKLKAE